MLDVETEVTIEAPRERVAGYAADPANAAAWYKHVTAFEGPAPAPLQVGSTFALVAQLPGRRMRFAYEVVELVPHERLVFRTAQGLFPMETTYSWSGSGETTVMRLHNRGTPKGAARLVAPLMAAGMRRQNRKDMLRLKSVLEDGAG